MQIDPRALNRVTNQVNAAFAATVNQYAVECRNQIESEVWLWPRLTVRSNNEIAGRIRDIVDTGELRDSQTFPLFRAIPDGLKARIDWTAEHAGVVWGGQIVQLANGNSILLPARPWTDAAAREVGGVGVYRTMVRECKRFVV
jgi:hypothetical protein